MPKKIRTLDDHDWFRRIEGTETVTKCWVWGGDETSPRIRFSGRILSVRRYLRWRMAVDENLDAIPADKLVVANKGCIDKRCVNPLHSRIVDPAEYTSERWRAG